MNRSRWADFLELTKPRISGLSLVTVAVGYLVARRGAIDGFALAETLLGTFLVAGGASALNQLLERDTDAKMSRTVNRPLPAGRLQPSEVLAFGMLAGLAGMIWLAVGVHWLAGFLAFATFASYVFLYTPLKRRTAFNTVVGAIPGAMPPVIGWAASGEPLGVEAGLLFGIVFLWQFPHFLAIAWLYRDEYARAELKMLPVTDREGRVTGAVVVGYCLALLPVSLLPTLLGIASAVYFFAALALGLMYLAFAIRFGLGGSRDGARHLLRASIVYLPALLFLLTFDCSL